MIRKRSLIIVVLLAVALVVLPAGCGGNRGNQDAPTPSVQEAEADAAAAEADAEATAEEAATEVPEAQAAAEATVEGDVEEAATEVPEAEQAAEATVESEAAPVATEVSAEEEVVDEAASQVEEMANPQIEVVSEANIADVIDNNNPTLVTLSSSGERLNWAQAEGRLWNREGELCLYTFETAASDCYVAPDDYHGYPYAFSWSPEDTHIAFTEDPISQGYESDIWVFDTASNEFVDLTDDGVEGSWVGVEPGTFALDYLPMWNHVDGHIYFWRSIPNPDVPISVTLSIMRVAPVGGQAELVREVQNEMGGDLILFNEESWYMDGVSALSPDGRHVAVLAVSTEETDTDDSDGLWIIDIEDTSVPPRQVATGEDFQAANITWTGLPLTPAGLAWQANGEHVIVLAENSDTQVAVVALYDVDVASGTMTPVVDFSGVPDQEAYMSSPNDEGVPLRFYSPWTATMSPDNEQLLMYQNLANVAGLMVAPLPPTGELPSVVFESQFLDVTSTVRSSRSDDGKVLIYNVLFNTTQP